MTLTLQDAITIVREIHSLRKTAAVYGVDHCTLSRIFKEKGVTVLRRAREV